MLISVGKTTLYMIELTTGFEVNLNINSQILKTDKGSAARKETQHIAKDTEQSILPY